MKSIKFIFTLFLVASLASCNGQQKKASDEGAVVEVVKTEVFEKAASDVQLVDVRTPGEYSEGYIKNAINIDIFGDDFMGKMSKLDKNKPVYVYCKSGHRSGNAAEKLEEAGFTKVYDLDGGFLQWKGDGKHVSGKK
ncbi:MAG: hypothetical protein COB73_03940 [Flavobacteriaceae bacterium]|nr:MAG: hypothetical protein COB73_03940 [Flavobacteriaceae bacterium]